MGKEIYDKAKVLITSLSINIIFCWNEGYCILEDDSLMVMRLVAWGGITTFDSIHFNLLTWILIFKVGFYGSHAKIP